MTWIPCSPDTHEPDLFLPEICPARSVQTGQQEPRPMPEPDAKLDQLLQTAIEQTRMLRLRYRNKDRIVEPHDYGQHNGVIKLLTWQVGGSSSGPLPNWRWMEIDQISDAHARPDLSRRPPHPFR